jgi:cell division protein FtsB
MFNVLSQNYKSEVWREYKKRRLLAFLIALFCLTFILDIFLFATFYSLSNTKDDRKAELANKKDKFETGEYDKIMSNIKLLNEEIAVLNSNAPSLFVSEIFEFISSYTEAGTYIENMNFGGVSQKNNTRDSKVSKSPKASWEVTIKGLARDREALRKFIAFLESNQLFKEVSAPVSNFAPKENLEFSIRLVGEI